MKRIVGWLGGLGLLQSCLPPASAWASPAFPSVALTPVHIAEVSPIDPLMGGDDSDRDPLAQINSIDQLSDVKPSDWAYQALKTLLERYGILSGYPNGTFQGNRSLSRYEFAAAIDVAISRIEQLFTPEATAQIREDFATVKRLQASYGIILSDSRDRIQALEALSGKLERQQFSTTTKLSAQAVFAFTDGTDAHGTTPARIRLDLNTSFTGTDLLKTELEAGNNSGDAISRNQSRNQNFLGTFGALADGGGLDFIGVPSAVEVKKLYYTFQPLKNLSVTVGPRLSVRDFIDYNRFANDSLKNFSSSFFMSNPLIVQGQISRAGGAGAAIAWKPSDTLPLVVRALYVNADAANPTLRSSEGRLFGDRNQGSVELEYAFSPDLVARLQYTSATVNRTAINAGGLNVEWAVNRQFALSGRFGVGKYKGFNTLLNQDLDLSPVTWALGGTIRNIVIPGSVAGIAIGQPFIDRSLGGHTQTNLEAYYSLQLNDSISFSPTLMVVTSPDNQKSSTVVEWALRLLYAF